MSAVISTSFAQEISNNNKSYVSSEHRFQVLSYAEWEHLWSYVGKVGLLTRNALNAIARSPYMLFFTGSSSPCKIKSVVTHLKLLSVVNIPFNLVELFLKLISLVL